MLVQQFYVDGIAHLSYLLGANRTCAIIDPKRDVDAYIAAAKELGLTITHILETHLHADFVSGHMDLAAMTGAAIYAPKSGACLYEHVAVGDGDSFDLEDMHIEVIDTPGHTPDCVCYVVTDRSRGDEPAAAFTGDTLFVGDVGRPDLFPGRGEEIRRIPRALVRTAGRRPQSSVESPDEATISTRASIRLCSSASVVVFSPQSV